MEQYSLIDLSAVDQHPTGPSSNSYTSETDWAPILPDTLSSNKSTSKISSTNSLNGRTPDARIARSPTTDSTISGGSRLKADAELFIKDRLHVTPSPSPPSFFSTRPSHELASISPTFVPLTNRKASQVDRISRLTPSPTSGWWKASSRGGLHPTVNVIEDLPEHQWVVDESLGNGGGSLVQPQQTSSPPPPYVYKNGLLVALPSELRRPEIANKSEALLIKPGTSEDKEDDSVKAKDHLSGNKRRASPAQQSGGLDIARSPETAINQNDKTHETRNDNAETIEGHRSFKHGPIALPNNKSDTSTPTKLLQSASFMSKDDLDLSISSTEAVSEGSTSTGPVDLGNHPGGPKRPSPASVSSVLGDSSETRKPGDFQRDPADPVAQLDASFAAVSLTDKPNGPARKMESEDFERLPEAITLGNISIASANTSMEYSGGYTENTTPSALRLDEIAPPTAALITSPPEVDLVSTGSDQQSEARSHARHPSRVTEPPAQSDAEPGACNRLIRVDDPSSTEKGMAPEDQPQGAENRMAINACLDLREASKAAMSADFGSLAIHSPAMLTSGPSNHDGPLMISSPTSHMNVGGNVTTTDLLQNLEERYNKLKDAYLDFTDGFGEDISRLSQIDFR